MPNHCFRTFAVVTCSATQNIYTCNMKGILVERIQRIPVLSAGSQGGKLLCMLAPGPFLTHSAVWLCCNKYPKDDCKGRQKMEMKRRLGACCASEWGHGTAGSAMSPRCWLVFDVENPEWAWFLMLCNFEDRVFEVMHELDSFTASSWFVFVFFFFSHHPFLLLDFFFHERHNLCVWSEGMFQGYLLKCPLW